MISFVVGITLYELHAPLMVLTTRDFEKRAITKDNLRERLKEVSRQLSRRQYLFTLDICVMLFNFRLWAI